jgi:hypothetical protein
MPKKSKKSTKRTRLRVLESIGSVRAEIVVGGVGFLLSIILHELFHLVMHWHQITGVLFFPNFYTIAQLVVNIPASYDLASEEFIAYSISAFVLICTAIIIGQMQDASDKRTVRQMLFPRTAAKKVPVKKLKKST